MDPVFLWVVVGALLLLGLLGTIIPALPGLGFVYGGILIYAIVTDFAAISVQTVVIFGILALLAVGADYAGSALGAMAGGGRRRALIGTLLGAVAGVLLGGPVGLMLGAFIGGFLGAAYEGASSERAAKIALYSVLGVIGAAVFQFALALAMIIAFLFAIFL